MSELLHWSVGVGGEDLSHETDDEASPEDLEAAMRACFKPEGSTVAVEGQR